VFGGGWGGGGGGVEEKKCICYVCIVSRLTMIYFKLVFWQDPRNGEILDYHDLICLFIYYFPPL